MAIEAQAVKNQSPLLVDTISLNVQTIWVHLYAKELITDDVKDEMALNITNRAKATRLVESVIIRIGISPNKSPIFIKILKENDGKEAAKALEKEIVALRAQGIS